MVDFSLRHLVRDVLDTSTMNDPHSIAPEVLRRIDDTNLRTALAECLPSLVREMIRDSRNRGLPPIADSQPTHTDVRAQRMEGPRLTLHTQPQLVMTESPDGVARPVATAPARRPAQSAKVAAIRESGPKWLRDRLYTSADPREWKRMGDCTFTDLMFAAAQRRDQAARTSAAAERLEALAELVHAHGVERVRDLPASVLAKVGGAAA